MAKPTLQHNIWRIIDQTRTSPSFTALYSFAIDDTLMDTVGSQLSPPVARAWVHDRHLILGSRDRRLPNASAAVRRLKNAGYEVIVRNSGGAAVLLDKGVFNLSLILPVTELYTRIDAGYEIMVELVEKMLAPLDVCVETGEVYGSYCPGRYDISIGGKKIGGIAQRRGKGGMAVQAFILAEGSGHERAEVVRSFYDHAVSTAAPYQDETPDYPKVIPETMASLHELTNASTDHGWLFMRLTEILKANAQNLVFSQLYENETAAFNRNIKAMTLRQERFEPSANQGAM